MAIPTRFLLPAILLFLTSPSKTFEGRRKIQIPDIPKLTASGALPEAARSNGYFFLDEASGDLILAYPADLDEENFGSPSDKKRVRERVRLAIGARPTVETLVTADAGFSYDYRLGNETGATQRLGRWVLELPGLGDRILAMKGPAGWGFDTWELPDEWVKDRLSVMNLIPETRRLTADDLVRKQASWWYRGLGGATLEPGTCCLSFLIRSQDLPGIVTAYFQGSPSKAWTSASVPRELSTLVPAFNFIETNSVSMPVIGPKFEPTIFVEARVCDLIVNVKGLVQGGRMEATPFTEGILAVATDCLKRTPTGLASAVEGLAARATNPFEIEILRALEMNLAAP